MKLRYRLAQFVAVFGAAIFLLAVPALAQECPQLVDQIVWSSPAHQVAAAGDYVYIGNDGGVLVVHYSGPGENEVVGGVGLPEVAQDMEVSAGYIYVADGESGLRVLDVTDPASPFEVGNYAPSEGAFSEVAIFGRTAYVIDPEFGLRLIDVTDPYSPLEVGSVGVDINVPLADVTVSSDCAYVASYDGFHVIEVSTPSSPFEVGFLPGDVYWGAGWAAAYRGGFAYTVGHAFSVIDVRDPATPVEVWNEFVAEYPVHSNIVVSNRLVFTAGSTSWPRAFWGRFRVYDLIDPFAPTELGSHSNPPSYDYETYRDLAVSGRYAYVTAGDDGVHVFDISGCAPLFSDGFESGDTTAWSAAVP